MAPIFLAYLSTLCPKAALHTGNTLQLGGESAGPEDFLPPEVPMAQG
jgi:hypothetical protein